MKRLLIMLLVMCWGFILISQIKTVNAQTSQNVILSCLDPVTLSPDHATINGISYHHLLGLKNRELNVFAPNQPIYIVRSFARVFCNPNDGDPTCVRDSEKRVTPCIQEKIGANICNQNCPWGHACTPNNDGPGITVCCMPLYSKQGPYFECANDKNNETVCPQATMAQQGQTNGIHISENGHIETGWESSFILVNLNKSGLLTDAEGNITIDMAQSYSRAGLDQGFYGMQLVSDKAITGNKAFNNSLKLAFFTRFEEIEPSATNCTTVYWDPYGKIIDSIKLEPISDIAITLKNLAPNGQIIKTSVDNNPTFQNPNITDAAGNFNFAVVPGTYFLEPSSNQFTFPTDSIALNNALAVLQNFDPTQEYISRDKIYNNSSEPIIEQAGYSERRDIILQPKDATYQGSVPSILYAENLRDGSNQLVRGRASHPKSIIKIILANSLIGQAEADMQGGFSIAVPESVINNNADYFQLVAEKVPLPGTAANTPPKPGVLSWLVKNVLAQTNSTSRPYSLSLVPVKMTGFVFDNTIQVRPNSIVELTVPSLGGISFSQTKADKDGYININSQNIPPLNFALTVRDPQKPTNSYQLTVEDFKKTNSVFLAKTNTNLYSAQPATDKPNVETINKIKAETIRKVPASSLSLNQVLEITRNPETETEISPSQGPVFVLVFVFVIVVVILISLLIIRKNKQNEQTYY